MKKNKVILFAIMAALLAVAATAFAADVFSTRIFNNYTGKAATARYSPPVNYGQYTKKTVTIAGQHSASVYAPYSGVVAFLGSSDKNTWVPLKDKAGNVVTATGNTSFDIDTMVPWIKAVWTRTKHNVTVWIHYSN